MYISVFNVVRIKRNQKMFLLKKKITVIKTNENFIKLAEPVVYIFEIFRQHIFYLLEEEEL